MEADPTRANATRSLLVRAGLVAFATFVIVLLSRTYLISRYGSSFPFYDQWGAEAGLIYTPLLDGEFRWGVLWELHNEHRILFTRLWAIALFVLNEGQWDGMVQLYANALLVAGASALASRWMLMKLGIAEFLPIWIVLVAALVLPVGWSNSLVGFQSCFYFVAIFSVLAIAVASMARISLAHSSLLLALVLASIFSLAVGVLVVPAVVTILALRWRRRDMGAGPCALLSACLLSLAVLVWLMQPVGSGLSSLRAEDAGQFLDALGVVGRWPFVFRAGWLQWLPAMVLVVGMAFGRRSRSTDLFFLGVSAWSFLVAASIAWSRGKGLTGVESRYSDLLILGTAANCHLAARMLSQWLPAKFSFAGTLPGFAASVTVALALCTYATYSMEPIRHWSSGLQNAAGRVGQFISGDGSALGFEHSAYLSPLTTALVASPKVAQYLPLSVSPLLPDGTSGGRACRLLTGSSSGGAPTADRLVCGAAARNGVGVSVGALSALSYLLWRWTTTSWMVPLALHEGPLPVGKPLQCRIEAVDDAPASDANVEVQYPGTIRLSGWIGPRSDESVRIYFFGEGATYLAEFRSASLRPDVADALNDAALEKSGFGLRLDGSMLAPGTYTVGMAVGASGLCDPVKVIRVLNSSSERSGY